MTEPQPTTTSADILSPPTPQRGLFGTKIPSTVTFAIGILLFFMPFVDLKCNDMSLQKIKGFELATGFRIKTNDSLFGNLDSMDNKSASQKEKKDPNMYALGALLLGVLGFLLSLLSSKAGGVGGLLTGSLAAVSLVMLFIDIKKQIKTEVPDMGSGAGAGQAYISVDFTPMFYITVLVFIAAAVLSYKRIKAG